MEMTAMSDGADQPPEQTAPAEQPSHHAGSAQTLTNPFFQGIQLVEPRAYRRCIIGGLSGYARPARPYS